MSLLPIVKRELAVAARKPWMHGARLLMAAAAACIALGIVMVSISSGRPGAEMGRDMFFALGGFAFWGSLMAGVALTADSIAGERRAGTLGLIFLSGIREYDLVLGKFAGALLPAFYGLLAMFPILGWAFFLGGLSIKEFVWMAWILSLTALFSVAAGLCVSAWCRDGRKALASAFLLAGVIVFLFPLPVWMGRGAGTAGPFDWLRWCSVAYAFTLTMDITDPSAQAEFMRTSLMTGLLALGFLGSGWIGVRCVWQDQGRRSLADARESRSRRSRSAFEFEADPMLWLETRKSGRLGRVIPGFMLVLVLVAVFGSRVLSGVPLWEWYLAALLFAHFAVSVWVGWEASRRFFEDRKSGALELLLACPIDERRIVRGWLAGLRRRSMGPVIALLVLDARFLWLNNSGAWAGQPDFTALFLGAVILSFLDLYALAWVGIWQGLRARNVLHAFLRTIGLILLLPTVAFLGLLGAAALAGLGGRLVIMWIGAGWLVFAGAFAMGFCAWSMHTLSEHFRAFAAEERRGRPEMARSL